MRWSFERRPADEVRALWIAAVCMLAFGLYMVHARYEPVIGAAHLRADRFYSGMLSNERLIREAAVLHRTERAAFADLRRVSRNSSQGATTAGLIAHISEVSRAQGVTLLSLEPQEAPSGDRSMPSTDLTIGVRGRFPALLQFIEDLSRSGTLLRVTGAHLSLAAAAQTGSKPLIDAAVRAVLYRPSIPMEEGGIHVSAR
jgi:hypothetical protein